MAKSPKSFPFPSPWQGDILAEGEERHQHSSEQPATTRKMPSPESFQEEGQTWQSPGVCQQIGLSPLGHGQVLAVMPARFGTCPGTWAKAGAPSGCIPSLLLANHSNGVSQSFQRCEPTIPMPCQPSPCPASLPLPSLAGHLQQLLAPWKGRVFWDDLPAECRIKNSSALQLLWRDLLSSQK